MFTKLFNCFIKKDNLFTLSSDFIRTLKTIIPNLENQEINSIKEQIKQFHFRKIKEGVDSNGVEEIYLQVTKSFGKDVLQGDIIYDIPFHFINENGDLLEEKAPGFLLSASCDFENDQTILFCKCNTLKDLKKKFNINELRNNTIYRFFNLMNSSDENKCLVVDFGYIFSVSKELVVKALSDLRLQRLLSLTKEGYYLFIIKLYIHFLRLEDLSTRSLRN